MGDSSVSQKFNRATCHGAGHPHYYLNLSRRTKMPSQGLAAGRLVYLRYHHLGGHSLAGIVLVMLARG